MLINQNSANIKKIAANVFIYEGSISTNEKLYISFPERSALTVKGNVSAKEGITTNHCDLQVYGNITAQRIECDGDLGAVDGTIFAPDGIIASGSVSAGKSIFCDNGTIDAAGDIVAEAVYCEN